MQHKPFIDMLRVISAFGVVLIHVTARFLEPGVYQDANAAWWIAFVLNSCCKLAVPVFLMISGYLVLGRSESWLTFYRHRYARLLPPFLFWNAVYLFLSAIFARNQSVNERLHAFVFSWAASSHLWYLPMLMSVLIAAPLLSSILIGRQPQGFDWWFLIGGLVIALFFVQFDVRQVTSFLKPISLYANGLFLCYLFLGYVLGVHAERLRRFMPLLLTCAIAGVAIGLYSDGVRMRHGYGVSSFAYLSLTVCLMASTLFLAGRLYATEWRVPPWVQEIADCSFGIYLIHMIVLRTHERLIGERILRLSTSPLLVLIGCLVTTVLVCLLSAAIISVFRKHRIGRILC